MAGLHTDHEACHVQFSLPTWCAPAADRSPSRRIPRERARRQASPRLDVLPVDGELPYLGTSFVLRAYSADERIVDAILTTATFAAGDLDVFFARDDVAFVSGRFAAYGCYALRVERR